MRGHGAGGQRAAAAEAASTLRREHTADGHPSWRSNVHCRNTQSQSPKGWESRTGSCSEPVPSEPIPWNR